MSDKINKTINKQPVLPHGCTKKQKYTLIIIKIICKTNSIAKLNNYVKIKKQRLHKN